MHQLIPAILKIRSEGSIQKFKNHQSMKLKGLRNGIVTAKAGPPCSSLISRPYLLARLYSFFHSNCKKYFITCVYTAAPTTWWNIIRKMRTALKSCSIKLLIKRCSRQLRPADISTERIFIKILWSTISDRTVFWSPRFWNSVYQVPFYFCVFEIIFMLHHILAEELSLHNLHNFALSFFFWIDK